MVHGAAFSRSSEACHPYSCDIFREALLCLLKIAGGGKESNKAGYCVKKELCGRVRANKRLNLHIIKHYVQTRLKKSSLVHPASSCQTTGQAVQTNTLYIPAYLALD